MARKGWSQALTTSFVTTDGTTIATLKDAADFLQTIDPNRVNGRQYWRRAVELMIAAAEQGGSIDAATEQLYRALFLDNKLKLG